MQRRLEAAIPDPAQRAQFAAAMQREVQMASVDGAVSPRAGSQTGRLANSGDDMQIDPAGGTLVGLLQAAQGNGLTGVGARLLAGGHRVVQGMNSNTSDQLAQRLFSLDQGQNAETLRRLLERRTMDQLTARSRSGLAGRLLQSAGTATSLEANDR